VRSENPIVGLQVHAIYTIRPRMWLAVDAIYYDGGRTTVNGFDLEQNSLVGITYGLPITRQQTNTRAVQRINL
jgi:hypothetical protein